MSKLYKNISNQPKLGKTNYAVPLSTASQDKLKLGKPNYAVPLSTAGVRSTAVRPTVTKNAETTASTVVRTAFKLESAEAKYEPASKFLPSEIVYASIHKGLAKTAIGGTFETRAGKRYKKKSKATAVKLDGAPSKKSTSSSSKLSVSSSVEKMSWQQFRTANKGRSRDDISKAWKKYKERFDGGGGGAFKLESAEAKYEPASKFLPSEIVYASIHKGLAKTAIGGTFETRAGKRYKKKSKATAVKLDGAPSKKSTSSSSKLSVSSSVAKMSWPQFRTANKGRSKDDVSKAWKKYKERFDGGGGGVTGWAWGSSKEKAKKTFSKSSATSFGFRWCYEHPKQCLGGVLVGGAVTAFAISTAWAWATAFLATTVWWGGAGLSALAFGYASIIFYRSTMLKIYDEGVEFAELSREELVDKVAELKDNQCYTRLTANCRTKVELLKTAEEVLDWQNKLCEDGNCKDMLKLFGKTEGVGWTVEKQEEIIQKRKDLYFGTIWSIYKGADDDKIEELNANGKKELIILCKAFTLKNKKIFQYKENNKLVMASVTGRRGILEGERFTKDILKVLADTQKVIIAEHVVAVDEWVELYKVFQKQMEYIKEGDLFKSLPKDFVKELETACRYNPRLTRTLSILLDPKEDKVEQMKAKQTIVRDKLDRNVKKLRRLVNALDTSDDESIVAKIREANELKVCFINSVADIKEIFRKHQKKLQKKKKKKKQDAGAAASIGSFSADILQAEIALEAPSQKLMKAICEGEYVKNKETFVIPSDAFKLAKWVVAQEEEEEEEEEDSEDGDSEDSDSEDYDSEDYDSD